MINAVMVSLANLGTYFLIATGSILALSDTVNGAILGLMLAVFLAAVASLKKLALLMIRFGEAIARNKIKTWAEKTGVDPKEILDD